MIAPARSAKEQFDRQAAHYDRQWNTWSVETLAWLLTHSGLPTPPNSPSSQTLLDVATGTGFTALAFAPLAAHVVATDVSSGMLAQATKRAEEQGITNVTFQEAAAEQLPFENASFDLVTCRIAAHHFLDVRRFAAETARVLIPGGALLLVDTTVPEDEIADRWQNDLEALRDPSHVRNYTPREWRDIIDQAGLQIEALDTPQTPHTSHTSLTPSPNHPLTPSSGITVPLEDWLVKAGCTPEQSAEVRRRFAAAPPEAVAAFQIVHSPEPRFTWQRIAIRAVKPT